MALLNGTAGKQPAPSDNADLLGGDDTEAPQEGAEGDAEEDDGSRVLFTVMVDAEGKYTLVTGDEGDDEDGLAAPEGASPAEGGTPAMPEGQQFDHEGPLLKAILDLIREDQGAAGDDGQGDFEDGFASKPKP